MPHAAGLDLEQALDTISGGAAGSWSLTNYAPRILRGDLEPGFKIDHFLKDLGIALAEAGRLGLSLPGTALAEQLYRAARAQGYGQKGTQALVVPLAAQERCRSRSRALDPANDEERDRHVLAGDRDERQRVEDLVVAEDAGHGIRPAPGIDERAARCRRRRPRARAPPQPGPPSTRAAAAPPRPPSRARSRRRPRPTSASAPSRTWRAWRPGHRPRRSTSTVHLQRPMEAEQADGRVRARDQQVDPGVVDPPHPEPGARPPADAVVERARGEHRSHGAREGRRADRRAATVGADDEERPGDERDAEADLVQDAAQQRPHERGIEGVSKGSNPPRVACPALFRGAKPPLAGALAPAGRAGGARPSGRRLYAASAARTYPGVIG